MESPRTKDEAQRLVKALAPAPVMINVLPHGLTGDYTTKDCETMGFKLAIFPCTGFIPATIAMKKSYQALMEKGTDLEDCQGWQIKDFFEVRPSSASNEIETLTGLPHTVARRPQTVLGFRQGGF